MDYSGRPSPDPAEKKEKNNGLQDPIRSWEIELRNGKEDGNNHRVLGLVDRVSNGKENGNY